MDLGLADKTVVVLASSAGLGLASARALAAEGARVALSGRDAARLEQARALVARDSLSWARRAGGGAPRAPAAGAESVLAEALDVTDGDALRAHLDRVRARFGAVHGLVTNAGGPPPATALEMGEAELERALDLALRSAVRATLHVLPWMRAQRFGRVVGLTSMSVRQPIRGLAGSNVARSALTAWFKTLAAEVAADGVLVNTVCSGLFATARLDELFAARARRSGRRAEEERALAVAGIPLGRPGDPRELGELVAFLCSQRSSFLTGVALALDGGASPSLL